MPTASCMASPALLDLQRAFAGALLHEYERGVWAHIVEDAFSPAERLRIYRNTCRSTLVATLRMTYPAVERLVGPAFFDHIAGEFAARHAPTSGYLNEYGAQFASFLGGERAAHRLAYLPDVARFEWALSVAANAPDVPVLDPGALLAVRAEQHAALAFERHPSVSCLELEHPADQIADAVLSGDEAAMAQVDLRAGAVCLVVHRGQGGLETERLTPRAYEFVSRLLAGEAFGRVLEAAPEQAPMLLAAQLGKGRLGGFRVMS